MRRTRGETGFLRLRAAALTGCVEWPLATEDFCEDFEDTDLLEDALLCGEVAVEVVCPPEAAEEELGFAGVDAGVDEEPAACAEERTFIAGQHRSAAASVQHSLMLNRATFLYRGDATRQRFCLKRPLKKCPRFMAGN
jgi:hypothetical protein